MSPFDAEATRRLVECDARAQALLRTLATEYSYRGRTLHLYRAGLQEGKVRFGLFGRDLLITARLLGDPAFTKDVLCFVADTLGHNADPRSGEEPGRGIHEFDHVEMRGYLTRYNAIDVTPLFLSAAAAYVKKTGDEAPIEELETELRLAIGFLESHVVDGLYVEDPAYAGATGYALRATYWKDSRLPGRVDPAYPVTYTLVQAQAIAALRASAALVDLGLEPSVKANDLTALTEHALAALRERLWDVDLDVPVIAIDRDGRIAGVSSDMLHMLAYLERGDLDDEKLGAIRRAAEQLATPYGYRTYAPNQIDYDPHNYHLGAIWPFEQALIVIGAVRHGQNDMADVAARALDMLDEEGFPELVYWEEGGVLEGARSVPEQGCDLQLWTLAVPRALLQRADANEN